MEIKLANKEDILEIHNLGINVPEFKTTDGTINFWTKETLDNLINKEDSFLIIARDEEIIGFIIANYNKSFKKAIIENLYVKEEKRGRGVASKLVEFLQEELKKVECEYISTLVGIGKQETIKFYNSRDFESGEIFVWLDKKLDDKFRK